MRTGAKPRRAEASCPATDRAVVLQGAAASRLARMPCGFADMAYLDPPFGTGQVWRGPAGSFNDRWAWDAAAACALAELRQLHPFAAELIDAAALPPGSRAYLVAMAELLAAMRRALRPAATMWLHCDDTMGSYLKLLADAIFGMDAYLGTLVWRRSSGQNNTRCFRRVHDTIFAYARTSVARWRLVRCRSEFCWGDPCGRFGVSGFPEDRLASGAKERTGYPTQKPAALLARLIRGATLPGALVLDPTCGSGTTLVAAVAYGRRALGIDVSADAVALATRRLGIAPRIAEPGAAARRSAERGRELSLA